MKLFSRNKQELVQSVLVLLDYLKPDSPWTMTITREKSGGYYASTVTDVLSEDSDHLRAKFFSDTQVNT